MSYANRDAALAQPGMCSQVNDRMQVIALAYLVSLDQRSKLARQLLAA
jgi:hypothetical protein